MTRNKNGVIALFVAIQIYVVMGLRLHEFSSPPTQIQTFIGQQTISQQPRFFPAKNVDGSTLR